MDSSSQFVVPTIIDVPELIVTNEDIDYDEGAGLGGSALLNKLQFLASALPYTVGLGTLWRFPHLCYKHAGGAFLVAYTIVLVAVGLPLFLMELAFGQYANEGPIAIWRISPAFEGIGYAMCLISAMVSIYYNVINAWIIHYLFASITFSSVPWNTCDNSWNTEECFYRSVDNDLTTLIVDNNNNNSSISAKVKPTINRNQTSSIRRNCSLISDPEIGNNTNLLLINNCSDNSPYGFDKIISTNSSVTLPANEYFHRNVLSINDSLTDLTSFNWDLLFGLLLAWILVFVVLLRNFHPPNKLALIGFLLPYPSLLAIFVRALTLPGSSQGILYYFQVDWTRLQNIDIWADAVSQIFFALSPCWGGIITLASMNKFHNNFYTSGMLLMSINTITSFFAGFVAFTILGYMSNYSGVAINEVVDAGIGFIFMVYTEALAKLPFASLNSLMFFGMLLFVGFTCQLIVIETVVTTVVDTWPHKLRYRRPLVLMVLCATMFLFSLIMCFGNGFYVMQLLDYFTATFTAMIVGIFELIAIAWVYGMDNFMQDIDDMISVHRNIYPSRHYWYFLWRYLTPSILFAVLIFCFTDLNTIEYRDYKLPSWSLRFGWMLTFSCVAIIPAIAIIRFLLSPRGSFTDKISYLCRPSEDWAPSTYVSGPKLLGRHILGGEDLNEDHQGFSPSGHSYTDQDQESNDSNEDLKVVDGKANYIIPEEEDDTDTGLITNETNV